MTKDEALTLALEALEPLTSLSIEPEDLAGIYKAITAIKEALAQPEQEGDWEKLYRLEVKKSWGVMKYERDIKPLTRIVPMAQLEQEPVAWRAPKWSNLHNEYGYRDFDDPVIGIDGKPSSNNEPLYTTPPNRPWVGLTGQEKALVASVSLDVHDAVHRTDAKLKEKNT